MTVDIDEVKVERNEFGLWFGWTLATAVGMLLGFLPSIPLVDALDLGFARVVVPILAGVLIGFAQWVVLRFYLTATSDWILAGGAAWAAGYALGLFLMQNISGMLLGGVLGYLLFGAIAGLVQWPVLRREIPNGVVWILANTLAWAIGFWVSQWILNLLFNDPVIPPLISTSVLTGVSGLVAGAISGAALVWIARQPDKPDLTSVESPS